jgi:pimeloyl-ACP methyl ester carboxylesterase
LPPIAKTVAAVALLIFATYLSLPLGLCLTTAAALFWAVHKVVTWAIHPAASPFFYKFAGTLEEERKALRETCTQVAMKTPDGYVLDGVYSPGTVKAAVIFVGGNGSPYERFLASSLLQYKERFGNPSFLFFNPRGVYSSEGASSPDMLPYDTYTAFEYLVSRGYSPDKICVVGFSLGGATGTLGAALAQQKHATYEIGAVNIISFANLPEEAEAFLTQMDFPTLGKIAAPVLTTLGYQLNAVEAWEVLRNRNKTIMAHVQDTIVPYPVSMHRHAKSGRKLLFGDLQGDPLPGVHNIPSIEGLANAVKTILGLETVSQPRKEKAQSE